MDLDLSGPDDAQAVAVLLHPDPRMGGNRHHPLVGDLFRLLPGDGVGAARFDIVDVDPQIALAAVAEVLDAVAERWPDRPTVLVGYSFGAGVAAAVADDRVWGWFLVAPQVRPLEGSPLADDPRPVMVVVPEHDQFAAPDRVLAATEGWSLTTVETVAGDHFLADSLDGIVASCRAWIGRVGGE